MMTIKKLMPLVPLFFGVLFSVLFYNQGIGINLVLFEIPLLLFVWPQIKTLTKTGKLIGLLVLLSLIFVVVEHTDLIIFYHFCVLLLFTGVLAIPTVKAASTAVLATVVNFFTGTFNYFRSFRIMLDSNKGSKSAFKFFKLGVLPLLVIWIFAMMYRVASPWFDNVAGRLLDAIGNAFSYCFQHINPAMMLLFIAGLLLSALLIYATDANFLKDKISDINETRKRIKNKYFTGKLNALSNEYKVGVILFAGLNALLLLVNVLDIYWVWFNFNWTGQFLKQFVHEGTYLLIFSIIISAGLVLYFFRGNQHFLQKIWLKRLAQAWMIQNVLLAISVMVRNWWYVQYFGLAFKRIGVFYFLAFVVIALITVLIMVKKQKTLYFIHRYNSMAGLLIFFCIAVPNWSVIIAKYNFAHYESAFVELNFLATLDKTALPYMHKSEAELDEFAAKQNKLFRFKSRARFIDEMEYMTIVNNRIAEELKALETQHWLSWNLADASLYEKLKTRD
jgi:hypothetical protein